MVRLSFTVPLEYWEKVKNEIEIKKEKRNSFFMWNCIWLLVV